jgi:hypothetical protein
MKKFVLSAILPWMLMLIFSACSKDDDNSSGSNLSDNIEQGSWRITLYSEGALNETSYFTGYSFLFSNGVVTATKGATVVTGSYSSRVDSGKNKFILNFGTTSPFDELNEDWIILENTSTKMRLQHISGGSGETDLLTFEKI